MKTKEQLIEKLNRKLDSYNRKARKYGYPTLWYNIKTNYVEGSSAMGANHEDVKLPGILDFIYAIYLYHLHDNLTGICQKIWEIEFEKSWNQKKCINSQQ